MLKDKLPAPVQELKKSKEGRKWLEKYQERHKVEIAQPGSELFEKAWGKKTKRDKELREKREREAQWAWLASKEVREYERKRQIENFKSKYH